MHYTASRFGMNEIREASLKDPTSSVQSYANDVNRLSAPQNHFPPPQLYSVRRLTACTARGPCPVRPREAVDHDVFPFLEGVPYEIEDRRRKGSDSLVAPRCADAPPPPSNVKPSRRIQCSRLTVKFILHHVPRRESCVPWFHH